MQYFSIVVALTDWKARTVGELTYKKGDQLEILNDIEEFWWLARHKETGLEGYIPTKLRNQNGVLIPAFKK